MDNRKKSQQNIWDISYQNKKQFSQWPWSDLVSACTKFCKLDKKSNVLEIGCGAGANVPFFDRKKCNYTGIDISKKAIDFLKKKNRKKNIKFILKDFLDFKTSKKFDLIVDRAAICCGNNDNKIKKILKKINVNLKIHGKFIGIDWYSKNTYYYNFYKNKKNFIRINKGPLSKIGKLYFLNHLDIKNKLKNFTIIYLYEKKINNYLDKNLSISTWSFVCEKKK
jgi:SAM-dependent methyltransferase